MFSPILQKFSEKSPVTAMVQGLLERLLHAEKIDAWFKDISIKKPVMVMKSYIYSLICHAIKQMRLKLPTYIVNAGPLKLLFKN